MAAGKNTRKDRIRRAIKESSMRRMSVQDLALRLDLDHTAIRAALSSMDDAYIIDWVKSPGNIQAWRALYAVVDVPKNAPMPSLLLAKNSKGCRPPMAYYQAIAAAEAEKHAEQNRPRTVWVTTGATRG